MFTETHVFICALPLQAALIPNDLYTLLDNCWVKNTEKRPNFKEIVDQLYALGDALGRTDSGVVVPDDVKEFVTPLFFLFFLFFIGYPTFVHEVTR